MRFPTYIDATNPQNTSGCSLTSIGPTETPWIISGPITTAVIGLVGMPRASNGTKAPVEAALFAVSGPATPATAPLPNSLGCFDTLRSIAYDKKLEIMCAEPGMM